MAHNHYDNEVIIYMFVSGSFVYSNGYEVFRGKEPLLGRVVMNLRHNDCGKWRVRASMIMRVNDYAPK